MNLWRAFFAKLAVSDNIEERECDIYLFCDASPQWEQGIELFAMSFELVIKGQFIRRIMLVINLSKDMLDLFGKASCLTWAIWLIVGPTFKVVRWFLLRVRGICTDMGTGYGIPNYKDFLPLFSSICQAGTH